MRSGRHRHHTCTHTTQTPPRSHITITITHTHAITIADAAAGLSLLRYTAIALFATAWLVAAEEQAGGVRLATMFQEAFYWLLLGLLLAGLLPVGERVFSTAPFCWKLRLSASESALFRV